MKILKLMFCFILPLTLSCGATQTFAEKLERMIVLTDEYPPFNYKDKDGVLTGVAVELLDKAYTEAGLKLVKEDIIIQPWPRSYKQVQNQTDIILLSMTRTPEREALFQWVGPITKTRIGLIAKKSRNIKIHGKEDIIQYLIGGNPSNIGVQLVSKLIGEKLKLRLTPHPESLVKMLEMERLDLWAYEERSAALVFESFNLNPDDYESVYTLKESALYYALNLKTDKKVAERLQAAIDSAKIKYPELLD